MEVSILRTWPGAAGGIRPPLRCYALLALCLSAAFGVPGEAQAFTIFRTNGGTTIDIGPSDILQGGNGLGGSSEQSFGQGTFPVVLSDFSQPLDLNIQGSVGGSAQLSARLVGDLAFAIHLSRAERNECLTDADFDVRVAIVNPAVGALAAEQGSGTLQVLSFEADNRGSRGQRCPNMLLYGLTLDLGLDGAISAGAYSATTEITAERIGPGGGQVETAQTSLTVVMPSVLFLYHPDSVDVDLRASAIAGILGASTSCGTDGCLDLGRRSLTVSTIGQPIPVGIAGAVGPVPTLQTVTLRNAIGARAIGCTGDAYTAADYQVVSAIGGIQPGSGVVAGIAGQPCGLNLTTGDISFDMDLAQAASTSGSATIQVTVTGI